jgi:hypothetical protein
MKQHYRYALMAGVVCLAFGWWLAASPASPLRPKTPERPVLRFIARIAKGVLWVMLVAEKPPQQDQQARLVHARVDADGHQVLNHGEGW